MNSQTAAARESGDSLKPFFITTPIYYINSLPHIGHFYTTSAADIVARYQRSRGRTVYFLTGTDEHGLKIARAAADRGISPQQHADTMAAEFRRCWDELSISYDDFIRTTEPRHTQVAQQIIERLWELGYLTLGTYSGWYSVPDETFFRPEDTEEREGSRYISNPTEDQSRAPLEWVEEPACFFRQSAFGDQLLQLYARQPDMVRPRSRLNETVAFLGSGLRDQTISRELAWGIPVPPISPELHGQSIYVWVEALMNYLSAPGYLSADPERRSFFESVWPPDLQLMSKDILRFHAVLWPSLLTAIDQPLPQRLFVHGFWTVAGRKMSKRDPATIVDPSHFARQISSLTGCDFGTAVDALRYYCFREVTFGSDGDFSRVACLARYNSDLANGLGNLVQRALSMLHRYFDGEVPAGTGQLGLLEACASAGPAVEEGYNELDFSGALATVWNVVNHANRLIEEQKPWARMKAGQEAEVALLMRELLAACQWCAVMLAPVMPHGAARLLTLLGLNDSLLWAEASDYETLLRPGHHCRQPDALFPRAAKIETMDEEAIMNVDVGATATTPAAPPPEATAPPANVAAVDSAKPVATTIEYADFAKVELRAGRIVEAERVPKADKLLKLQVDLGGDDRRQILAGLAQQFDPQTLIGKTVIVVANLAPRQLRGLESQGMLLAASVTADGPPAGLLTVDPDVPAGSIIR